MAKKSKTHETEKLDEAHILLAIKCLENKGTKKEACAILGINYNTTRLNSIIEKFQEEKKREKELRQSKRGTPATKPEIEYIISSYLEGGTVDSISNTLFRPTTFVVNILDKYGVPRRQSSHSYFTPSLIPEESLRDSFSIGEIVYSARYDSLAKICSEFSTGVYRIYLLSDKWQQYAYQPNYELASLQHIRNLGISI